ncbi:MAG: DUF4339 domain-containing protein [Planctomycetaceae bacterium]|jgi:hypothetical protein|nr:DUF4339 domain-containing protein [Planctomycetaceae bacterium]
MANWYYYDNIGKKHGPIDVAQLKMLALQGIITPETIIENRHGQTRKASEVNGLCPTPPPVPIPPNISEPNSFNSSTPSPTESSQHSQTNHSKLTGFQANFFLKWFFVLLEWLLDFQFKLCYFFIIERRILKIGYFLFVVVGIIGIVGVLVGAVVAFGLLWSNYDSDRTFSSFLLSHLLILFITIGELIGILLFLVFMRLIYEFYIFMIGWLVDTRQAAQHIISSSATADSEPDKQQ